MGKGRPPPAARSCGRRPSGLGRLPPPPPREPPPPERALRGVAGPADEPLARAPERDGGGRRGVRREPASSSKNDTSSGGCPPVRPDRRRAHVRVRTKDGAAARRTPARMETPTAPTVARPGDAPVRVLDRYTLLSRLGAGGFGTVWLARDARLDRDVAVKQVERDRVVEGRGRRGAPAPARLHHPAIVALYEAEDDERGTWLVSELVRGASLGELLEDGALSDRDVGGIGLALLDALGHAHARGVIHRDVKPANVLVPDATRPGDAPAKLTDFGVAHLADGDLLTKTGDVVGTLAYMAPEQAEGGRRVTP